MMSTLSSHPAHPSLHVQKENRLKALIVDHLFGVVEASNCYLEMENISVNTLLRDRDILVFI